MAEEAHEESGIWQDVAKYGMVVVLVLFVGMLAFTHLSTVASLLMLSIGVGGALALGIFVWGLSLYLIRMGNEYRAAGLHIMQWSIAILFVVVALGALLRFVDRMLS